MIKNLQLYVDPSLNQISNDPLILSGSILMALGIVVPCLIWFTRNLYRVVGKKDFWWLNKLLKICWIIGLIVFLIGFIMLIVKLITGAN